MSPTVVPAPTQLPRPTSLTVTSAHFVHAIRWAPGPGMPPDVHYSVTYILERCVPWFCQPGSTGLVPFDWFCQSGSVRLVLPGSTGLVPLAWLV